MEKGNGKIDKCIVIYESKIENFFIKLGFVFLKYLKKMLICCVLVNILLLLGMINIKF